MRMFLLLLLLRLPVWSQTPQLPQPGSSETWVEFIRNRWVTVNEGNGFWLWDVERRKLIAHLQGLERILELAASPDHRFLVATDYPSCARVYRLADGHPLYVYQPEHPNSQGSYEVQFSSDGRAMLLLGGSHGASNPDPRLRQIDLTSGRELRSFDFGQKRSNPNSILSGPQMRMARAAGTKLEIWDLKSGLRLAQRPLPEDYPQLSSHPEGVVCQTNHHKALYSWADLHKIRELPPPENTQPPVLSPDGKFSWSKDETSFKVTRLSDQKILYQGPPSQMLENWLSLGFQIYLNQPDTTVGPVYDFEGKELGSLPRILLGYPEHLLVTNQPGYGGPLTFYDYKKVKAIGHLAFATPPAYSADGKTMAVLTRKGVLLLDIRASLSAGKLVPCR